MPTTSQPIRQWLLDGLRATGGRLDVFVKVVAVPWVASAVFAASIADNVTAVFIAAIGALPPTAVAYFAYRQARDAKDHAEQINEAVNHRESNEPTLREVTLETRSEVGSLKEDFDAHLKERRKHGDDRREGRPDPDGRE
jgi:hypothetical protein